MIITSVEFVSSVVDVAGCPKPVMPEYAFIGRSNVGKSSLINMLVNKKGLAKTSGTPGKTRTINHYILNSGKKEWYLVDLPGYGYAKIAMAARKKWELFIRNYVAHRENLMCTFILVDSRHAPLQLDIDFMLWMGNEGLPFSIIFTKCDKLTKNQLIRNFEVYEKKILEYWNEMPNYFLTSADSQMGKDKVLGFIEETNKMFTVD